MSFNDWAYIMKQSKDEDNVKKAIHRKSLVNHGITPPGGVIIDDDSAESTSRRKSTNLNSARRKSATSGSTDSAPVSPRVPATPSSNASSTVTAPAASPSSASAAPAAASPRQDKDQQPPNSARGRPGSSRDLNNTAAAKSASPVKSPRGSAPAALSSPAAPKVPTLEEDINALKTGRRVVKIPRSGKPSTTQLVVSKEGNRFFVSWETRKTNLDESRCFLDQYTLQLPPSNTRILSSRKGLESLPKREEAVTAQSIQDALQNQWWFSLAGKDRFLDIVCLDQETCERWSRVLKQLTPASAQ